MRSNGDLRNKRWLPAVALSIAVCIVSSDASVAAEAEAIGELLPSATEPSTIPAEVSIPEPPKMQSLALPGERVVAALSQVSSDKKSVTTRGARENSAYEKAAPSVVLVLTENGFGSGSYIGSNQIITNWHVVSDSPKASVVFFDSEQGFKATVEKIDQARDLALLEIEFIPENLSPLKLGSNDKIHVGDDVHAIGHPNGFAWTYTKGFVSAIRPDYEWTYEDDANKAKHRATVIQTQTPINPGNSGGPLLSDDGEILGLNTVSALGAQGLNFAVSVDDIRAFLDSSVQMPSGKDDRLMTSPGQTPSAKIPDRICEVKKLYEGKGMVRGNRGWLAQYDTNCDAKADFSYFYPHKKSVSALALIDTNFDGKADIEIQDWDRNGKWDISYYDSNYDGRPDLVGRHPNGELEPSYYDKFAGS